MKIRDLFAGAGAEPPRRVPLEARTIYVPNPVPSTLRIPHVTWDDVQRAGEVVHRHTARARLNEAQRDFLAVMARVHPTPTYDAVAADLGYDPRMTL